MPRSIRNTDETLKLPCDDSSDTFIARYTNMGDPFREGILIGVENEDFNKEVTVMLQDYEAKKLRDLLIKHYPV